jgi:hypothetical protein
LQHCNISIFHTRPQRKLSYLIVKHLRRISAHYCSSLRINRTRRDNRLKYVKRFPRRTFSQLYEYAVQNMTHPVHLCKVICLRGATYTSISRLSTTNSHSPEQKTTALPYGRKVLTSTEQRIWWYRILTSFLQRKRCSAGAEYVFKFITDFLKETVYSEVETAWCAT